MFEAKKKRAFALQSAMLWAFFFPAIAHASTDAIAQQAIATGQSPKASAAATKPPDLALLPNVAPAPAPANPTVTTATAKVTAPNQPANPVATRPIASKPTAADKSSDALTDLPASKRLAISVLAGVLTLIAALWIGARRD